MWVEDRKKKRENLKSSGTLAFLWLVWQISGPNQFYHAEADTIRRLGR